MQHIARKRFGQNFLVDQSIIGQIVHAISPRAGDSMVEIGPGLGALTRPLLEVLPHLHVVEIDRDIVARLESWPKEKLTIHSSDALKFNFGALGKNLRIVGNLPYNISTPLLFHLTQFCAHVQDMHFMLQKEVVERMIAEPSSAEYGRLSVMTQYFFEMEKVLEVPAIAFNPVPKVVSAVIRMFPIEAKPLIAANEDLFAKVVASAFAQRRKTVRNALRTYLAEADFNSLEIESSLRPENLSLQEFLRISNYIAENKRID